MEKWTLKQNQHEFDAGKWNATVFRRNVRSMHWHIGLWTPSGYVRFKEGSQRNLAAAQNAALKCLRHEAERVLKAIACRPARRGGGVMSNFDYAYPRDADEQYPQRGLTKRELFAAMAMQGMCAGSGDWRDNKAIPKQAVEIADALLAELRAAQRGGEGA